MERLTCRAIVAFDLELVPPPAGEPELETLIERGLDGLAFPLPPRLARISNAAVQSITEPAGEPEDGAP